VVMMRGDKNPSRATQKAAAEAAATRNKTYGLKSWSGLVNHYELKKHHSGAMLLEGVGKCANKIPLSTRNKQLQASLVSEENEEMDFIADMNDEMVEFYVKQLLAQNALREVYKIGESFVLLRNVAVEDERTRTNMGHFDDDQLEQMIAMEEINRIKKEEEDVQHRSQSPVLEQILGVPKHLGGFEAQSLAELEGLSTAFTPLKKDQHPSASSLDDLTLEGLGIEESEPVTESAMKPSKNEMEKLAKQQKKEREAAKKLKAERERREKKQVKALGGSSIANLLGKAADKKSAVTLIMKHDPTAAAVASVNNEKPPKKYIRPPKKVQPYISAYLHFIEEKRAALKKEVTSGSQIKNIWPDIKDEASRRWDFEMSETDKMPYFKMEWDDRNRYEKEMKDDPTAAAVAFVNNEKPRRNLSAYVHFIEEKRAGIKEVERLTNIWPNWPKIKEEYTRKWDFEMSETDKIPYFKMAADDKDRFEKEKKEYVLKSGEGGNGHAPCEALDDVKEEKTEEKITERRELNVVRKEITATLRGIEDSFDLVLEDAENKKKGAYENAEKFLRELRAILARMSIVI
jgi:hypothetical protein